MLKHSRWLNLFPAALLMLALAYYYIGAVEKPQHLLFYTAFVGLWWQSRAVLKQLFSAPLFSVLLGYIVYQAVSLTWSDVFSAEELGEVLRKGALTIAFVVSAALLWLHEKWRVPAMQAVALTAAVSAAIALFWHLGAVEIPERMNGLGRSINAVQGGCLYGFALVIAAWLGRKNRANRLLWGLCWLVLLAGLLATLSRGAMLAALVAHLFLLSGEKKKRTMMLVGALGILAVFALAVFPELWQRADGFRFAIWQEVASRVQSDWLIGLGYRIPFEFTLPYGQIIYQPHSIYLTALYYGGMVGLVALAVLLLGAWKESQLEISKALLAYAVIIGAFDFSLLLVNGEIEWLLFWLPLAMVLADFVKIKAHENTP